MVKSVVKSVTTWAQIECSAWPCDPARGSNLGEMRPGWVTWRRLDRGLSCGARGLALAATLALSCRRCKKGGYAERESVAEALPRGLPKPSSAAQGAPTGVWSRASAPARLACDAAARLARLSATVTRGPQPWPEYGGQKWPNYGHLRAHGSGPRGQRRALSGRNVSRMADPARARPPRCPPTRCRVMVWEAGPRPQEGAWAVGGDARTRAVWVPAHLTSRTRARRGWWAGWRPRSRGAGGTTLAHGAR